MSKQRDTYKYVFKVGNKIVYGGITNDVERREQEHKNKWPTGHIVKVGRRTTEDAARKWEEEVQREGMHKAPPIGGSRQEKEYRQAVRAVLPAGSAAREKRSNKRSTSK
jgi:predicted GIY-YIG superfamily endonuclease